MPGQTRAAGTQDHHLWNYFAHKKKNDGAKSPDTETLEPRLPPVIFPVLVGCFVYLPGSEPSHEAKNRQRAI